MPGRNMSTLEEGNGGCQLKQNQPLQPGGLGGIMGTIATLLLKIPLRVIVFLILLARASFGGFMDWALNILGKAVSYIVAKYQLLFLFLVIVGFMTAGANAQIPDGSSELKTFAVFWESLAKTNVKVAVGTIVAVVGGIGIAGTCMHSRRSTFTEADITDGLARGPTVARRCDPTFEIPPPI